jgi:putative NADH-flavin reductase
VRGIATLLFLVGTAVTDLGVGLPVVVIAAEYEMWVIDQSDVTPDGGGTLTKEETPAMKLALVGASGTIGQRILREALRRGHEITAIVRDPSKITNRSPKLQPVVGNVLDAGSVAAVVKGHDAVLSAYGPGGDDPDRTLVTAARALITGLKAAGVNRLVVVGGAGTLEIDPGVQLMDTSALPDAWKGIALAHRDAKRVYDTETDLEWSYVSPAAFIEPGDRTGTFRIGGDQLLTDAKGESRISAEDFAVALLDEVEQPKHIRKRFTVAY